MPNAIRVHETGDASVLKWEPIDVPAPGPGEVAIRHTAIGLNFVDVYNRSGLYKVQLPYTPGQEAAGVVTALGAGVTSLKVGQRIAYAGVTGAYAEQRTIDATKLVVLPDDIDDQTAASVMLKGMTAEYLLLRCAPIERGQTILFHAAAGGVGLIATQWARALGARVIGAVGSEAKAKLARAHCDEVVLTSGDWVSQVKALTKNEGVRTVFDSVGKDTVPGSLEVLARRGMLVSFGQSSGKADPLDLISIGGARSLYVTRPSMHAYVHSREEIEQSSKALFAVLESGAVKLNPPQTFALSDAADAHRALEGRKTTGSVVLLP